MQPPAAAGPYHALSDYPDHGHAHLQRKLLGLRVSADGGCGKGPPPPPPPPPGAGGGGGGTPRLTPPRPYAAPLCRSVSACCNAGCPARWQKSPNPSSSRRVDA